MKDSVFFIIRAVSYFLLYGLTIDLNNTVITSITSMLWPKEEPLGNEKLLPKISMDVHRMPRHKCTHIPHEVRDEADVLKYDFNSRMKNVLFNSMVCAYYVGFVPICFLHVSIAMNYTFFYESNSLWYSSRYCALPWWEGGNFNTHPGRGGLNKHNSIHIHTDSTIKLQARIQICNMALATSG